MWSQLLALDGVIFPAQNRNPGDAATPAVAAFISPSGSFPGNRSACACTNSGRNGNDTPGAAVGAAGVTVVLNARNAWIVAAPRHSRAKLDGIRPRLHRAATARRRSAACGTEGGGHDHRRVRIIRQSLRHAVDNRRRPGAAQPQLRWPPAPGRDRWSRAPSPPSTIGTFCPFFTASFVSVVALTERLPGFR